MLFLDEVKINVKAGNGGNGSAHFRREAHMPDGGPDGGHGGKGGNVVVIANKSLNTLIDYFRRKKFVAENGEGGGASCCHGKNGKDLILQVPVGTMVFKAEGFNTTEEQLVCDLEKDGDSSIIAHGGKGGIGNIVFKTSTNQAPTKTTPGTLGELGTFVMSMRLTADVGLVGLPNSGKSSFLARVSNAKPKIGDYPFTTIAPSLGFVEVENYNGFTIADIPGLIQNAHLGRGLGDRFLKHIEKCKVLFHIMDASADNPVEDFLTIKQELALYQDAMGVQSKTTFVVLNKCDLITKPRLKKLVAQMEEVCSSNIHTVCTQKNITIYHKNINELLYKAYSYFE